MLSIAAAPGATVELTDRHRAVEERKREEAEKRRRHRALQRLKSAMGGVDAERSEKQRNDIAARLPQYGPPVRSSQGRKSGQEKHQEQKRRKMGVSGSSSGVFAVAESGDLLQGKSADTSSSSSSAAAAGGGGGGNIRRSGRKNASSRQRDLSRRYAEALPGGGGGSGGIAEGSSGGTDSTAAAGGQGGEVLSLQRADLGPSVGLGPLPYFIAAGEGGDLGGGGGAQVQAQASARPRVSAGRAMKYAQQWLKRADDWDHNAALSRAVARLPGGPYWLWSSSSSQLGVTEGGRSSMADPAAAAGANQAPPWNPLWISAGPPAHAVASLNFPFDGGVFSASALSADDRSSLRDWAEQAASFDIESPLPRSDTTIHSADAVSELDSVLDRLDDGAKPARSGSRQMAKLPLLARRRVSRQRAAARIQQHVHPAVAPAPAVQPSSNPSRESLDTAALIEELIFEPDSEYVEEIEKRDAKLFEIALAKQRDDPGSDIAFRCYERLLLSPLLQLGDGSNLESLRGEVSRYRSSDHLSVGRTLRFRVLRGMSMVCRQKALHADCSAAAKQERDANVRVPPTVKELLELQQTLVDMYLGDSEDRTPAEIARGAIEELFEDDAYVAASPSVQRLVEAVQRRLGIHVEGTGRKRTFEELEESDGQLTPHVLARLPEQKRWVLNSVSNSLAACEIDGDDISLWHAAAQTAADGGELSLARRICEDGLATPSGGGDITGDENSPGLSLKSALLELMANVCYALGDWVVCENTLSLLQSLNRPAFHDEALRFNMAALQQTSGSRMVKNCLGERWRRAHVLQITDERVPDSNLLPIEPVVLVAGTAPLVDLCQEWLSAAIRFGVDLESELLSPESSRFFSFPAIITSSVQLASELDASSESDARDEEMIEVASVEGKEEEEAEEEAGIEKLELPFYTKAKICVTDLGEIISEVGARDPVWHNKSYIFPKGFRSECYSEVSTRHEQSGTTTTMISEILDAAEHGDETTGRESKPIFRVTPQDFPEDFVQHTASSKAWSLMREKQKKPTSISGPEQFGLSHPQVKAAIRALDGADSCQLLAPLVATAPPKPDNEEEAPQEIADDATQERPVLSLHEEWATVVEDTLARLEAELASKIDREQKITALAGVNVSVSQSNVTLDSTWVEDLVYSETLTMGSLLLILLRQSLRGFSPSDDGGRWSGIWTGTEGASLRTAVLKLYKIQQAQARSEIDCFSCCWRALNLLGGGSAESDIFDDAVSHLTVAELFLDSDDVLECAVALETFIRCSTMAPIPTSGDLSAQGITTDEDLWTVARLRWVQIRCSMRTLREPANTGQPIDVLDCCQVWADECVRALSALSGENLRLTHLQSDFVLSPSHVSSYLSTVQRVSDVENGFRAFEIGDYSAAVGRLEFLIDEPSPSDSQFAERVKSLQMLGSAAEAVLLEEPTEKNCSVAVRSRLALVTVLQASSDIAALLPALFSATVEGRKAVENMLRHCDSIDFAPRAEARRSLFSLLRVCLRHVTDGLCSASIRPHSRADVHKVFSLFRVDQKSVTAQWAACAVALGQLLFVLEKSAVGDGIERQQLCVSIGEQLHDLFGQLGLCCGGSEIHCPVTDAAISSGFEVDRPWSLFLLEHYLGTLHSSEDVEVRELLAESILASLCCGISVRDKSVDSHHLVLHHVDKRRFSHTDADGLVENSTLACSAAVFLFFPSVCPNLSTPPLPAVPGVEGLSAEVPSATKSIIYNILEELDSANRSWIAPTVDQLFSSDLHQKLLTGLYQIRPDVADVAYSDLIATFIGGGSFGLVSADDQLRFSLLSLMTKRLRYGVEVVEVDSRTVLAAKRYGTKTARSIWESTSDAPQMWSQRVKSLLCLLELSLRMNRLEPAIWASFELAECFSAILSQILESGGELPDTVKRGGVLRLLGFTAEDILLLTRADSDDDSTFVPDRKVGWNAFLRACAHLELAEHLERQKNSHRLGISFAILYDSLRRWESISGQSTISNTWLLDQGIGRLDIVLGLPETEQLEDRWLWLMMRGMLRESGLKQKPDPDIGSVSQCMEDYRDAITSAKQTHPKIDQELISEPFFRLQSLRYRLASTFRDNAPIMNAVASHSCSTRLAALGADFVLLDACVAVRCCRPDAPYQPNIALKDRNETWPEGLVARDGRGDQEFRGVEKQYGYKPSYRSVRLVSAIALADSGRATFSDSLSFDCPFDHSNMPRVRDFQLSCDMCDRFGGRVQSGATEVLRRAVVAGSTLLPFFAGKMTKFNSTKFWRSCSDTGGEFRAEQRHFAHQLAICLVAQWRAVLHLIVQFEQAFWRDRPDGVSFWDYIGQFTDEVYLAAGFEETTSLAIHAEIWGVPKKTLRIASFARDLCTATMYKIMWLEQIALAYDTAAPDSTVVEAENAELGIAAAAFDSGLIAAKPADTAVTDITLAVPGNGSLVPTQEEHGDVADDVARVAEISDLTRAITGEMPDVTGHIQAERSEPTGDGLNFGIVKGTEVSDADMADVPQSAIDEELLEESFRALEADEEMIDVDAMKPNGLDHSEILQHNVVGDKEELSGDDSAEEGDSPRRSRRSVRRRAAPATIHPLLASGKNFSAAPPRRNTTTTSAPLFVEPRVKPDPETDSRIFAPVKMLDLLKANDPFLGKQRLVALDGSQLSRTGQRQRANRLLYHLRSVVDDHLPQVGRVEVSCRAAILFALETKGGVLQHVAARLFAQIIPSHPALFGALDALRVLEWAELEPVDRSEGAIRSLRSISLESVAERVRKEKK